MPSVTLKRYYYPSMWMTSQEVIAQLYPQLHIGRRILIFLCYVTSSPGAISSRCSIVTESLPPAIIEIMGPKDIRSRPWPFRSCDVIGHMTNRSAMCHFLLVSCWNRVPISNRFRDICIRIYLGHDLHLSGSRDITCHVTIWFPRCHFHTNIITESLSRPIFKNMGSKHIGITTLTSVGHVTSSVTWPIDPT